MDLTISVDQGARDVLTTLIQVGGGFLTGVAVAVLGFRHARRLDRDRWQLQMNVRREDLDRQRSQRWLADKRATAARLVAAAEQLVADTARRDMTSLVSSQLALNSALAEVRLIAPELADTAAQLYRDCDSYINLVMVERRRGDPLAKGPERDQYLSSLEAFIQAGSKALARE